MATYNALLKGYRLYVTFSDGSSGFDDFEPTEKGFNELGQSVNDHFDNAMSEVNSIVIKKNWSAPGETVTLTVQHQQ